MFTSSEEINPFIQIQRILEPEITVEIGAYDADFSCAMVGNNAVEVYAFEASPFVHAKFRDQLTHINYINLAISDLEGTCEFEIQAEYEPSLIGNNSIRKRNYVKDVKYIEVPSSTLDIFFEGKLNKNFALWIDCEGANEQVLKGAERLLDSTSSIYIETETKQFWKDSWLESDVEHFLTERNFKLVSKTYAYEGQNNCIFVKSTKINSEIISLTRSHITERFEKIKLRTALKMKLRTALQHFRIFAPIQGLD
jgi:FkbM family methyltransferase